MSTRAGAIIAGAGSGTRLGLGSKAFVALNGRSVLSRVLDVFLGVDEIEEIVVVAPAAQLGRCEAEVRLLEPAKPVSVCAGGDTRQQSVRAGLARLEGCSHVLVHDAARPLVSRDLVRRVLRAAVETGAAIPGIMPRDAVKRIEGGRLVESIDRAGVVLAQTPQGFSHQLLLRAHFEAADAGLSGDDDAQLVGACGHPVVVVPGEASNLKLTNASDLELLEALIREHEAAGARP